MKVFRCLIIFMSCFILLTSTVFKLYAYEALENKPIQPMTVVLVPEDADKRVLVPQEDIGQEWKTEPIGDDTLWLHCTGEPGGVGFDQEDEYAKHISLDVSEHMAYRQTTCYVQAEFEVKSSDLAEFDYLALQVRFDDGFVAFINGHRVVQENAPAHVHWRSGASQPHEANSTNTLDISQHLDKLKRGNNILAIHALNVSGDSPDFLISAKLYARKNYYDNFASNLPIISIEASQSISTSASAAQMGIIQTSSSLNKLSNSPNEFSGTVKINKIANEFDYPKFDYEFAIQNQSGDNVDAAFLGLESGDEWLLYASYSDKTLLRNALMCEIARGMGVDIGATRFVHVFIDGGYFGIYLLMEKRNPHPNRVNITEMSPQDKSGDALTGGYIFKIGRQRWLPGFASPNPPYRGGNPVAYQYVYPDAGTITPQQQSYLYDKVVAFENGLMSESSESISEATMQQFDIYSFADYFILNEFAKNVNAYRMQSRFYKDRDSQGGRIHLEPTWNFEHAAGNVNYYDGWSVQNLALDHLLNSDALQSDTLRVPAWWATLLKNNDFTKRVYKRWFELNDSVLSEDWIITKLDSLYRHIREDREFNFERWQVIGKSVWPNQYVGISYDDDFDFLFLWMIDRLDWLNEAMMEFETGVQENLVSVSDFTLKQNYPNPFNPVTRISYRLPREALVSLTIYDVRGNVVDGLVNRVQLKGEHDVHWDASNYASGIYFYTLKTGAFQETRRMVLLR